MGSLATVMVRVGDQPVPYSLPSELTVRQAAMLIAEMTLPYRWWLGDWRLFHNANDPTLSTPPKDVTAMVPPDNLFETLDGYAVVLGWVNQVEIWN